MKKTKRYKMLPEHKKQLTEFLLKEAKSGEEMAAKAIEVAKQFRECVEALNSDDELSEEQGAFLSKLGIIETVPKDLADLLSALDVAESMSELFEVLESAANRVRQRQGM
jgi:hypothetical protein